MRKRLPKALQEDRGKRGETSCAYYNSSMVKGPLMAVGFTRNSCDLWNSYELEEI